VPHYYELPPPPALGADVRCIWHRRLDEPSPQPILPDGCMDVIALPDGRAIVAGADTAPAAVTPARGPIVGVRFGIGRGGAVLGIPARELRDQRVALADVWGRDGEQLERRLRGTADPDERARLLTGALARRVERARRDEVVEAAVERLAADGAAPISALARELAIGERQLLRRFGAAVGYGPRTLRRVLRMRRLLRALAAGESAPDLAWLARELGYADQPHMTRECVALTGRTPSAIRAGG
jgi:AraC-like DNA-binding protein